MAIGLVYMYVSITSQLISSPRKEGNFCSPEIIVVTVHGFNNLSFKNVEYSSMVVGFDAHVLLIASVVAAVVARVIVDD